MPMIRPVLVINVTAIANPPSGIFMGKASSPLGTKLGTRQPKKG